MKLFIGFLLCSVTLMPAKAQDSLLSKSSISMNMGLSYVLNKDAYRSPFTYHGLLTQGNINYRHNGVKSMHNIWAYYISGTTKTSFSPLASSRITEFSYDWLVKVYNTPKLAIYVGPSVNFYGWQSDYFPELKTAKINSWYIGVTAGLAANFTYRLNDHNIFYLQGNLPFAGYTDRPDLLNGANQNNNIAFFNTWNPHLRFIWEHQFSKHFSTLIQYDYTYLHTNLSRELNLMSNGISFGLKFTFGKHRK